MRVERPFSRPVELGRQRASLQKEMLTWKTSQLGFPLERAWSSLKTGKIVTEAYKIHTP
jgi:hypothetical protein